MTTINPIGGPNQNQALDPNSMQNRMQQALAPVAQLFGESTQQLESDLNSGKTSLSALASQKGISQADLINAIKQGLQSSAPAGSQAPSDTQLTNIANRIANHKHGGGHHHHGGGGGGVSSVDGTTSSTDPLTSGSSATASDSSTQELLQLLESQNQNAVNQSL